MTTINSIKRRQYQDEQPSQKSLGEKQLKCETLLHIQTNQIKYCDAREDGREKLSIVFFNCIDAKMDLRLSDKVLCG